MTPLPARLPTLALAVLALLPFACKQKPAPAAPMYQAPAAFRAALGEVYGKYLIVEYALAMDQEVLAINAASAMHGKMHEVPADSLTGPAKAYWDNADAQVMTVMHNPDASSGLPGARRAFAGLTLFLVDAMDKFGVTAQDPIFLFQCTQGDAFKDALWLQKERMPRDPYSGRDKAACGDLVREIENAPSGAVQ